MADARRAHAERRAAHDARVVQTGPVGGPPCRSLSPAANAATGPAGNEQQASSQHPSVRRDGRTTTPSLTPAGSSSHARRAPMDAHSALLLARELLHYHPIDDLYDEWLARITELVSAVGGSPVSSLSLPRPPSCMGNAAQGAPGQLLAGEGLLGSSALAALAPDGAGSAQGPRALEPWRLPGGEVAGTTPELHCPRGAECGAAERTAQESPLRRGRARRRGRAIFVDVVDGAVAQELVCREERSSSLQGCTERAGQRTGWCE